MKLYPRLARRFANDEFEKQGSMSVAEREQRANTTHPMQTWPATGAVRVTVAELSETREAVLGVARDHGWPEPLTREKQRGFDLAAAQVLWERASLTPAEAGFGDVWSFLALVLVPDVVWWRASGSTNIERFVGTDLTRHTLARLWWRAHLLNWGTDDSPASWSLWAESSIGEADLDQIQTRRGGYGRSPKMFRSLLRAYPTVIATATSAETDRRELWRQAFLRWLLRLGAFTNFSGLTEDEITEELLKLTNTPGEIPIPDPGEESEPTEDTSDTESESLDDQPLQTIVVRITEAVRARGSLSDTDLCAALLSDAGITVSADRDAVVRGIAWQGKTLGFLTRTDNGGIQEWAPGETLPAPDRRWGEWSITSFKRYVAGLDPEPDEQTLAQELFRGRSGRTVRRVVKLALREKTTD
jgi:hypothetical protein